MPPAYSHRSTEAELVVASTGDRLAVSWSDPVEIRVDPLSGWPDLSAGQGRWVYRRVGVIVFK